MHILLSLLLEIRDNSNTVMVVLAAILGWLFASKMKQEGRYHLFPSRSTDNIIQYLQAFHSYQDNSATN